MSLRVTEIGKTCTVPLRIAGGGLGSGFAFDTAHEDHDHGNPDHSLPYLWIASYGGRFHAFRHHHSFLRAVRDIMDRKESRV